MPINPLLIHNNYVARALKLRSKGVAVHYFEDLRMVHFLKNNQLKQASYFGVITAQCGLFDGDFDAGDGAAGEGADLAGLVHDDTIALGVDGEVTAEEGAGASALGHAYLADNNHAGFDFLAAVQLNSETLTGTIVDIFGCTASFYV